MPGTDRKVFPEKVHDREGNETNKGGLLAPIGNPLGSALNTGLSPVGAGVGALTGSISNGAASVTKGIQESSGLPDRGEEKEKEAEAKEKIGGKEQTADNPMGL